MTKDQFGFVEVKAEFWIPENAGDSITGVVVGFEEVETQHGDATMALVADLETHQERGVLVSGGLGQLTKQSQKLVRITYEGEKENPKPKKGRSKFFKSFKLEVAGKFDYAAWALAD